MDGDKKSLISDYINNQLIKEDVFNNALNTVKLCSDLNFTISSPGKLILFGEHSVVYGKSALAASINKRTYLQTVENSINQSFAISMRPLDFYFVFSFEKLIELINHDIPGNDGEPLRKPINEPNEIQHDQFFEILKRNLVANFGLQSLLSDNQVTGSICVFLYLLHGIFYKENSEFLRPLFIDIYTELTLGAGTGSSASFCVSIAAALLHYRNIKLFGLTSAKDVTFSEQGLKLISKWAFNGEKIMHGKPSGIDNTVATFGSFIEIKQEIVSSLTEPVKRFLNLHNPPKIHIMLVDTGVLRNTSKLVQKVSKLRSGNSDAVNHILNAMHEVCEKASQVVKDMGHAQANNLEAVVFELLEELVDVNQGLLYSLGVSHKCLQEICLICSEYDLHAKLTGAGGGGYAFVLIPPEFDEKKLLACIDKLLEKNFKVCDIDLGTEGVRLEEKI